MAIETYYNSIFKKGNLSVRTMYLPNQKGTGQRYEGAMFTAHRVNTRPNRKYTNGTQTLSYVETQGSFYLSFEYGYYDRNSNSRINNEVLVSYPHLSSLERFLSQLIESIKSGEMFDGDVVSASGEKMVFQSEPFAGNKSLFVRPSMGTVYSNNRQVTTKGFELMVGDSSMTEFLPFNSMTQLITQLYPYTDTFNFRIESRLNEQIAVSIETNNLLKKLLMNQGVDTNLSDSKDTFGSSSFNQGSGFSNQNQGYNNNAGWGQQQSNQSMYSNPYQQQPMQQQQPVQNPFVNNNNNQQNQQSVQNPFVNNSQGQQQDNSNQSVEQQLAPDNSRQHSDNPFATDRGDQSNNTSPQPQQSNNSKSEKTKINKVTGDSNDLKSKIFENAENVDTSNLYDDDLNI